MSYSHAPASSFGQPYTAHPATPYHRGDAGVKPGTASFDAMQQPPVHLPPISMPGPIPGAVHRFPANPVLPVPHNVTPSSTATPPFQLPPDLLKNLANIPFPPPPYPPPPLPNSSLNRLPPSYNGAKTPDIINIRTSDFAQPDNPIPQDGTRDAIEDNTKVHDVLREDGELSDGELEESSTSTQPGGRVARRNLPPPRVNGSANGIVPTSVPESVAPTETMNAIPHAEMSSSHPLSSAPALSGSEPRKNPETSQKTAAANENTIAYRPVPVPPPGLEMAGEGLNGMRTHPDDPIAPVPASKTAQHTSAISSLRTQVKDALRSLRSNQIDFDDLAGEGINPSILKSLYEELEQGTPLAVKEPVAVAPRPFIVPDRSIEKGPVPSQNHVNDDSILEKQKLSSPVVVEQQNGVEDNAVLVPKTPLENEPFVQPQPSVSSTKVVVNGLTAQNEQPTVAELPHQSPVKPVTEVASTNMPPAHRPIERTAALLVKGGQPSSPTSSSNPAIERKDRIAQLLAARSGRVSSPLQPIETQTPKKAITLKVGNIPDPASEPSQIRVATPPSVSQPVTKTKNEAQTELIRQRMAALQKETLGKAQKKPDIEPEPSGSSLEPVPTAARQTSPAKGADALEIRTGIQIPGLFMAGQTPDHGSGDAPPGPEQPSSDAIPMAGPSSHSAESVEDEQPIKDGVLDEQVEPSELTRSAPAAEAAVRSDHAVARERHEQRAPPMHEARVRVWQKRQLASDAFDKTETTQTRSSPGKVEENTVADAVSDAESGEIEDVEMDLDEGSADERPQPNGYQCPSSPQEPARKVPRLSFTDRSPPQGLKNSQGKSDTSPSTPREDPKDGRDDEASTPSGPQAVLAQDKNERWKAKQQEIELIRKRIIEMEEKRKAKHNATLAAPGSASRPSVVVPMIRTSLSRPVPLPTQESLDGISPVASNPEPSNPEPPATPIKAPSPTLAASRPNDLPNTPSTPLHSIKEPLGLNELRQKLLRGRHIQKEKSVSIDVVSRRAKLAEKRARLEDLKREAERHEEEIREEAELLEAEAHEGAGGTNEDANATEDGQKIDQGEPTDGDGQSISSRPETDVLDRTVEPTSSQKDRSQSAAGPHAEGDHVISEAHVTASSPDDVDLADMGPAPERFEAPPIAHEVGRLDEDESNHDETLSQSTASPASVSSMLNSLVKEDKAIVSPPPLQDGSAAAASVTGDHVAEALKQDVIVEDGSVSMSDSGCDEYEPAEAEELLSSASDQPEADSEIYEPAEAEIPGNDASPASASTATAGIVQDDDPVETGAMTSPKPSIAVSADNEAARGSVGPAYRQQEQDFEQRLLSDNIQGVVEVGTSSPSSQQMDHKASQPKSHFVPYETPGRYFKTFRYDDRFPSLVANGFKSLTFSNNIDPKQPFCLTELAGDECRDPFCNKQHFHQIELTDDKILAQMSTAQQLNTKAEQDRWVSGLRKIIANLREQGVKDFQLVAESLAAYRRRFPDELSRDPPSQRS